MQNRHPDLDALIYHLRTVAASHATQETNLQVPAQSWFPAARSSVAVSISSLQTICLSSRSMFSLSAMMGVDESAFIDLVYRHLMGRSPDEEGRRFWLQQLSLRVPRLEVLARIALEAEALKYFGRPAGTTLLARMLVLGLHRRLRRIGRAVLRRLEWRLARRFHRNSQGLFWQLAKAQDAQLQSQHVLQEQHDKVLNQLEQKVNQHLASHVPVLANSPEVDAFFAAFEAKFRGDPQPLAAQLEQDYLVRLTNLRSALGQGPCLDLGCGRGLWLDLLRRHGFEARGADLNELALDEARRLGLQVSHLDALDFLQQEPDNSALAITAFHLMEHLPFALRLAVVKECARVLKPGGWLILETPNPENIWVGTHTFYHDPTHSQPLTPDSLAFLVNYHGLQTVEVLRLHPYPVEAKLPGTDDVTLRLNGMTCCGQDFAVIAQKPL